jgi:hypothetical protein
MSKIEVDAIEPQSGTTLTIGASGDTINIPSGATLTNSGTATGFGKVLQVVTATDSTQRSTSSTTFVTASNTLSVAITPSSTSNKIFVITTFTGYANDTSYSAYWTIFRDATNLGTANGMINNFGTGGSRSVGNPMAMSILDSPNTTSEVTYQVYTKVESGSSAIMVYNNVKTSITAFEIAG